MMYNMTNKVKKAIKWYFNQYSKCYDERYYKYSYRLY